MLSPFQDKKYTKESVSALVAKADCVKALRLLRPRILKMQAYDPVGHVDLVFEYQARLKEFEKKGKYNEKTSET